MCGSSVSATLAQPVSGAKKITIYSHNFAFYSCPWDLDRHEVHWQCRYAGVKPVSEPLCLGLQAFRL
ncbi:hypothetical protein AOLI_G00265050 [Acnodon oligacanthus]